MRKTMPGEEPAPAHSWALQYRVCFRWEAGYVDDVEITDDR